MSVPKPTELIDTERKLLGLFLLDPYLVRWAGSILLPDDFASATNRAIFVAMFEAWSGGTEIDILTIRDLVAQRGLTVAVGAVSIGAYLSELLDDAGDHEMVDTYARDIRAAAIRRRFRVVT